MRLETDYNLNDLVFFIYADPTITPVLCSGRIIAIDIFCDKYIHARISYGVSFKVKDRELSKTIESKELFSTQEALFTHLKRNYLNGFMEEPL